MHAPGICTVVFLLFAALPSFASKDTPFQTVTWPNSGTPVLRFTFSKFKLLVNGVGKEHTYVTDATAENLSDKTLGSVEMSLYVFDKTQARIGDGNINLANVGPRETVKFEITLYASGSPVSVSVAADAPRTLSVTINSVPQGATVTLDGKEIGTTPKIAEVTLGKHMLTFSKEGYNTGQFPLEMGPTRDARRGQRKLRTPALLPMTPLILRVGSVLSGMDLLSVDAECKRIDPHWRR